MQGGKHGGVRHVHCMQVHILWGNVFCGGHADLVQKASPWK